MAAAAKTDGDQQDGIQFDSLIGDILEGRRQVPVETRNQLMFTMVARIYTNQVDLEKRIKRVEDYSILLWIDAHPWATTIISALAISLLLVVSSPDLRQPFLEAVGITKQLAP